MANSKNNKNNKKKNNNRNSNKSVSMKKEVIIKNNKEEVKEETKKVNNTKTKKVNTTAKKNLNNKEKPIKKEVNKKTNATKKTYNKKVNNLKEKETKNVDEIEVTNDFLDDEEEFEFEDNYEDIIEDKTNKTSKYFIYILLIPIIALLVLSFINKKEDSDSELNYTMRLDAERVIYEIENKEYVESEEETDLVKIDVKDYGIMIAELYPSVAPKSVENFKKLVSEKFYDGLIFHRVVKDFVIQTGDPTGTGTGGSDETVEGEFELNGFENTLSHTRGVLSMARQGGNPETEETMNSADSQFFIVHQDNQESLDGRYAAFGKVINGLEVIDKVASVKTDEYEKPVKDQIISSIKFVNEVKYVPTEGE